MATNRKCRKTQRRRSAEGSRLDHQRRHFCQASSSWQRQMETRWVGVPGDLLGLESAGLGWLRRRRRPSRRYTSCSAVISWRSLPIRALDYGFGPVHAPNCSPLWARLRWADAIIRLEPYWRVGKWLPLAVDWLLSQRAADWSKMKAAVSVKLAGNHAARRNQRPRNAAWHACAASGKKRVPRVDYDPQAVGPQMWLTLLW